MLRTVLCVNRPVKCHYLSSVKTLSKRFRVPKTYSTLILPPCTLVACCLLLYGAALPNFLFFLPQVVNLPIWTRITGCMKNPMRETFASHIYFAGASVEVKSHTFSFVRMGRAPVALTPQVSKCWVLRIMMKSTVWNGFSG